MIDFAVIGGGIAGISAAARLSDHGSVLVLEAESALGTHASGRSAALFEPNYGNDVVKALNRLSAPYHHGANGGGYLTPRGFLLLGTSQNNDAFETDLAALVCDEISVQEALDFVPILRPEALTRAAYHVAAMDIDTDRMIQDFARDVRANGGEVRTGARVTAIARGTAGWDVSTGDEAIQARVLINAAGPWADEVARLAGVDPIGLQPYRRSMARIAAPDGHDLRNWPIFFGAGETWYAKPDAGQLIVSPADEDPMPPCDAWPDDMVLAEGLARYQAHVRPEVTRPTATWAGLRTFAPDRTLVLGPDPQVPGFIWCAGQGGYGFQTAPGASATVAALVAGTAPDLPQDVLAALSPARFQR